MKFRCLLCNKIISLEEVSRHKSENHRRYRHYGIMWQIDRKNSGKKARLASQIIACPNLARLAGVKMLYVLNEGLNLSGSMKDYLTARAVSLGKQQGYRWYTVVSSGNQAVSLAMMAGKTGAKVAIFVPASSHKISFLCSLPNTLVFGVDDSIFEDVYTQYGLFSELLPGVYNANVCNELLLAGLADVWRSIEKLSPYPTHILAGVGNGSYLAGFYWGISHANTRLRPKIVPVGMEGAFPAETALKTGQLIHEYKNFKVPEAVIDAAEGSIAIGSYSMPQLVYAVEKSCGLPIGGLTNNDLASAYEALCEEKELIEKGVVPEPTGIMGLAAALKNKLPANSVPVVVFTGHAIKDLDTIMRINDAKTGEKIVSAAKKSSPLLQISNEKSNKNIFHVLPKTHGVEIALETVKALTKE